MNTLDILVIVILAASLIIGYARGFVRQAGSICAVILAVVASRMFGLTAAQWFAPSAADGASSITAHGTAVAGYAAVFIAVWIAVWLVSRLLHGALRTIHLGAINSLAGALFSLAEWGLGISIALNLWHLCSPSWQPQGSLAPTLMTFMPWLTGAIGNQL